MGDQEKSQTSQTPKTMGLTYGGHKLVENTTKKVCSKNPVIISKQYSDILFLGMIIPHLIDDLRERNKNNHKRKYIFLQHYKRIAYFLDKIQQEEFDT